MTGYSASRGAGLTMRERAMRVSPQRVLLKKERGRDGEARATRCTRSSSGCQVHRHCPSSLQIVNLEDKPGPYAGARYGASQSK